MLELAGDVADRRILDAGCGSGPLSAALRDRGAVVTGIDASIGMLELARQRLGADADLANPLPFSEGAFDDVVASLVLHYLKDWGPTLTELRRVLTPGGRLLVSVDHPFVAYGNQRLAGHSPDYFQTYNWTFDWIMGGQTVQMSLWARPLHAMTDAFTAAGFRICTISEPPPVPAATPSPRNTKPSPPARTERAAVGAGIKPTCSPPTTPRSSAPTADKRRPPAFLGRPPLTAGRRCRSPVLPQ
jgi:SAM-dependent methyltransferase